MHENDEPSPRLTISQHLKLNVYWASRNPVPQVVLFVGLVVGVCVATGVIAKNAAPAQWQPADWANVVLAGGLGFAFFFLAVLLGRGQARQARALADSALHDHIGNIVAGGLLSRTGGAGRSVEVGRHALAALPLIDIASADMQARFLSAIEQAYSGLALNVFPNNDALPRVLCDQLHEDGRELVAWLGEASGRWRNIRNQAALGDVKDLIARCLELEKWYRKDGDPPVISVEELRRLYERELQVYSCWKDPRVKESDVCVYICPVNELRDAFSVWYVKDKPQRYTEVDYAGQQRTGLGECLHFECACDLELHPTPLQHDVVSKLPQMRRDGVKKMQRLMRALETSTITVFVHRLATGERVVLDGNHRLAAALRWQGERVPRAIVFELRERPGAGAVKPEKHQPPGEALDHGQKEWIGLSPDIQNVRRLTANPM
jgi:hypothetical protein